jgi:lipoate-protein ligase A
MAADEVLLQGAVAGRASLRFYGWSPPTLSLGYFQPAQGRSADPQLATLPMVRRPSGGDALLHEHELTYALGLPPGPPWQSPGVPVSLWLGRMHAVIAGALARAGIPVQLAKTSAAGAFTGFLCFHHIVPADVVLDSHKVVGSAQRRSRGALLQHGAILLRASPHAPTVLGIEELTGRWLEPPLLAAEISRELDQEMSWCLMEAPWQADELARIEELATLKYHQATWNEKR